MQRLRLVGVHEDGEHLLLSNDDGSSFRLRIDEALRAATARPIGRPDSAAVDKEAPQLSPREIQSRIRAGATAEQVAAESGVPLANVLRYDGPVRAEREYVAQQARSIEVSGPQGHEGYRSAFGDGPARLGEMVEHRLTSFGVDSRSLEWDAWRRSDGAWDVVAVFALEGGNSRANIGEEPPARWVFHPARKMIQNSNRWAQVLSEIEPVEAPLSVRRLTAVADHPFDVEAAPEETLHTAGPATGPLHSEELLDVLRARRGHRLGTDEESDDALALMLSHGSVPAAHPRDEEFIDAEEAVRLGLVGDDELEVPGFPEGPLDDAGLPWLYDGVGTATSEFTVVPGLRAASAEDGHPESAGDREPASGDGTQVRRTKPKRSSVPSWDEIVFGRKPQD